MNIPRKELIDMFGMWNISEMKACSLPQKAASAFTAVTGELIGAEYMPVLYVGSQPVNGTNYCILAVQTVINAEGTKRLVKVIINEAPGGKASLVSVSGIAI